MFRVKTVPEIEASGLSLKLLTLSSPEQRKKSITLQLRFWLFLKRRNQVTIHYWLNCRPLLKYQMLMILLKKYSESIIQPAIDRFEKLDFYQDHPNMLDLRRNRRERRNKEVRGFASEFTSWQLLESSHQ